MSKLQEPERKGIIMNLQAQAQNLIFSNPEITKDDLRQTLKAHLSFEKMMTHTDETITPPDEERIESAIMDAYAVF